MLHQRIAIDKTYGWFGEKVDLKQFLEAGRVETYENWPDNLFQILNAANKRDFERKKHGYPQRYRDRSGSRGSKWSWRHVFWVNFSETEGCWWTWWGMNHFESSGNNNNNANFILFSKFKAIPTISKWNSFEAHTFTSDDNTSSCTLSKYEMIKY